eukprot:196208_1
MKCYIVILLLLIICAKQYTAITVVYNNPDINKINHNTIKVIVSTYKRDTITNIRYTEVVTRESKVIIGPNLNTTEINHYITYLSDDMSCKAMMINIYGGGIAHTYLFGNHILSPPEYAKLNYKQFYDQQHQQRSSIFRTMIIEKKYCFIQLTLSDVINSKYPNVHQTKYPFQYRVSLRLEILEFIYKYKNALNVLFNTNIPYFIIGKSFGGTHAIELALNNHYYHQYQRDIINGYIAIACATAKRVGIKTQQTFDFTNSETKQKQQWELTLSPFLRTANLDKPLLLIQGLNDDVIHPFHALIFCESNKRNNNGNDCKERCALLKILTDLFRTNTDVKPHESTPIDYFQMELIVSMIHAYPKENSKQKYFMNLIDKFVDDVIQTQQPNKQVINRTQYLYNEYIQRYQSLLYNAQQITTVCNENHCV